MARLTKAQRKHHQEAEDLLARGGLDAEEQTFVIDNWHEGARHMNGAHGAHFTPYEMAFHLAIEVDARRVLDLCAGIGALSVGVLHHSPRDIEEMVLVELNPDYAAIARKLLPQAEVIVGSVYDRGLIAELASRNFTTVISNPPFGSNAKDGERGPRYRGDMDYEVIDIASDLAPHGVFIIPQSRLPFAYSGQETLKRTDNPKYHKFSEATDIELEMNLGIDTSNMPFRDVKIAVEIAIADFALTQERRRAKTGPADVVGKFEAKTSTKQGNQYDMFAAA